MNTPRAGRPRAAARLLAAAVLAVSMPAPGAARQLVELFPGYGNPNTLVISGRVFDAPRATRWGAGLAASRLAKPLGALVHLVRRGPGDRPVVVRAGGVAAEARPGPGGSFRVELPAAAGVQWSGEVKVTAVSGAGEACEGAAYVPNPAAKTGVISTFEETIAPGEGRGRYDGAAAPAVPGMPGLYARLAADEERRLRPVCYVAARAGAAGAPTVGFLSVHRFPPGPLLLMKPGPPGAAPPPAAAVYDHLLSSIQDLLAAWPEKKFVLFGAAGREDPDIFRCIAARYRARIRGVYLRRGGPRDAAREGAYPGFFFFDTAEEAANDLARKGLLRD
jgi:hypothetical protein